MAAGVYRTGASSAEHPHRCLYFFHTPRELYLHESRGDKVITLSFCCFSLRRLATESRCDVGPGSTE